MNLLLDTHILLWWLADDPALPAHIREEIINPLNMIFVSAASAWEISIKQSIGKLNAPADLEGAIAASHFQPLAMTMGHAIQAGRLPRHHDDPFDRMLIAQAQMESLKLVTHDRRLLKYGIPIVQA